MPKIDFSPKGRKRKPSGVGLNMPEVKMPTTSHKAMTEKEFKKKLAEELANDPKAKAKIEELTSRMEEGELRPMEVDGKGVNIIGIRSKMLTKMDKAENKKAHEIARELTDFVDKMGSERAAAGNKASVQSLLWAIQSLFLGISHAAKSMADDEDEEAQLKRDVRLTLQDLMNAMIAFDIIEAYGYKHSGGEAFTRDAKEGKGTD